MMMPSGSQQSDEPIIIHTSEYDDESLFCRSCSYVGTDAVERCPSCKNTLYRRISRPPKPGMIRIPTGSFVQGVSEAMAQSLLEKAAACKETYNYWFFHFKIEALLETGFEPCRQVHVPAFDIDTYPVTNEQYADFCRATDYPHHQNLAQHVADIPHHPVVHVSWIDSLCYALWAGKRLPTCSEWQKSARGSLDDRLYPWGNQWDPRRSKNFDTRGLNCQRGPTTPVDSFTQDPHDGRSPYGVCDLVGNVMEWVADKRDEYSRSRCGGAWNDIGEVFCTVAAVRSSSYQSGDNATGFRCASDIVYDEVAVAPEHRHE